MRLDRLLIWLGIAMIALVGVIAIETTWSERQAVHDAELEASKNAIAARSLLVSEMQKFRLLPSLLADYPDVSIALRSPDAKNIARVNQLLAVLKDRTHASDIYVMDRSGLTIAASNWRSDRSFVGKAYGFRPYFQDAMRTGAGRHFALGTVSREPGLYLSQRIDGPDGPLGVLAVKIEFFETERTWALQSGITLAFDRDSVAIVSSRPDLRLRTLNPLSPEAAARYAASGRFPGVPMSHLPLIKRSGSEYALASSSSHELFVGASADISDEHWTLLYLAPLEPYLAAHRAWILLVAVASGFVVLVVVGLIWRLREKQAIRIASLVELERQVDLRTAELQFANDTLVAESRAREDAVRAFREAREELARANRLTILGAICAEVAHEISQPVAAIRSFSENSSVLLSRKKYKDVDKNISHIVSLTERIGDISSRLRAFSVITKRDSRRYTLLQLLEGALLIIGESLRQHAIALKYDRATLDKIAIKTVRVRMEQVLVNLMQNSLQAMAGQQGAQIEFAAQLIGDDVEIVVSDNGPGVPDELLGIIFAPFMTSKRDGMGLGLGISRDIITSMGGCIDYRAGADGGATFVMRLKAA